MSILAVLVGHGPVAVERGMTCRDRVMYRLFSLLLKRETRVFVPYPHTSFPEYINAP